MADKGKLVTFTGEVRWATIPPRQARGPANDYTTDANRDDLTYSIEVECPEDKFKALKKAGIPKLTELKEDEATGKTYLKLKAPKVKTNVKDPNSPYEYSDIKTYNGDGTPLTESVGNGSQAVVTAYLKDNPRGGKYLRLHAVRVTDLVPYEGGGELSEEERKALGLPDEMPQLAPELVDDEVDVNDIF